MGYAQKPSLRAILGWTAALLNLAAFGWYGWTIIVGTTTTNPVTWFLWLVETMVSLTIYRQKVGDRAIWVNEAASLLGVCAVCAYLVGIAFVGRGNVAFGAVELVDAVPVLLAVGAYGVFLKTRKSKHGASISVWVFQLALLATIVPLARSAFMSESTEPLGPWLLWTLCFLLQAWSASQATERGKFRHNLELVLNPLNYAIIHGLIAYAAW